MGVKFEQIVVTLTGASGSAASSRPINGKIVGVHLAYTDIAAATCDVTIATNGNTIPATTVLTRSDSVTAGWFYPQVALNSTAAAAVTYDGTRPIYGPLYLCDYVTVSVAQADAGVVTATILYEG